MGHPTVPVVLQEISSTEKPVRRKLAASGLMVGWNEIGFPSGSSLGQLGITGRTYSGWSKSDQHKILYIQGFIFPPNAYRCL